MRVRRVLPLCVLPLVYAAIPGCSADISEFSYRQALVNIQPRVLPGGTVEIEVTAENDGTATWEPNEVTLVLDDGQGFASKPIPLKGVTEPQARGSFKGTLQAPTDVGIFRLRFDLKYQSNDFGPKLVAPRTEVTCSDGMYCNGVERYVGGKCVPGSNPCDDGAACSTDACDEAGATCSYQVGMGCAACKSDCIPDCTGKVCGDDGCGGSCGGCPAGEACAIAASVCKPTTQSGSCAAPIEIVPPGIPFLGVHEVDGDSTDGLDEATPTCYAVGKGAEKIYQFTATEKIGIEARASGYDTVLHLRKECANNDPAVTIACNDDALPPGNSGSRIDAVLDPGTYFLVVDGSDATQFGPHHLQVKFTANGCIPHCNGLSCGPDDGCGGDCGACSSGFTCTKAGVCRDDACMPNCTDKECGDDGCGGSCGACSDGTFCVAATSKCQSFPTCNHEKPTCTTPCDTTQFCGVDCACHPLTEPMPDLVINAQRLADEVVFDVLTVKPSSCALAEACVGGIGDRKLVRFSVEITNQGQASLVLPPSTDRPDLFSVSACQGSAHYKGFAEYRLIDKAGGTVRTGRKQAQCVADEQRAITNPNVSCEKNYTCDKQGLQAGWVQLFPNSLDCQWLDVTDVPAGDYFVEVVVNPDRQFEEVSFDNNSAKVPITIQ